MTDIERSTPESLSQWGGLDWHESAHRLCVVDPTGRTLRTESFAESPEGFADLVTCLRKFPALGGVALEATRQPVALRLSQAGVAVYPVNPKQSAAWRKGLGASEAKDDDRDALALAAGLCMHHERLTPLVPDTELAQELAIVAEDHAHLIQERTSCVLSLEAVLKLYFRQVLEWFPDWTDPAAWAFVAAFPGPAELAGASKKKLYGFFKTRGLRLTERRQGLVEGAATATAEPGQAASARAYALRAQTLVRRLQTLQLSLEKYDARLKELFDQHPDKVLYESVPGAGDTLEPRLATVFGEKRERVPSAVVLQELSGVAPVTFRSGKGRPEVRFRWACDKYLRNTMHLFAQCTLIRCGWARAFYDLHRARGDCHALALRKLAGKWLKILYRMWLDHAPYDEERYLKSLKKRNSPVWRRLQEQAGLPGG